MNIIVLSGSPRKGGNTEQLIDAFVSGASKLHNVEVISINDYRVSPCIGCNSCFKREDKSCFQNDDMTSIYSKLMKADMLVIASPVYFYGISAQLKAVIDRCHNPIRDTFSIKQTALILVGAATLPELFDSIITQYELCLKFFNLKDSGKILVSGCREKGDVTKTDALRQAYELGTSIA